MLVEVCAGRANSRGQNPESNEFCAALKYLLSSMVVHYTRVLGAAHADPRSKLCNCVRLVMFCPRRPVASDLVCKLIARRARLQTESVGPTRGLSPGRTTSRPLNIALNWPLYYVRPFLRSCLSSIRDEPNHFIARAQPWVVPGSW